GNQLPQVRPEALKSVGHRRHHLGQVLSGVFYGNMPRRTRMADAFSGVPGRPGAPGFDRCHEGALLTEDQVFERLASKAARPVSPPPGRATFDPCFMPPTKNWKKIKISRPVPGVQLV